MLSSSIILVRRRFLINGKKTMIQFSVDNMILVVREVAAAPQTPQLGGGPRPTLGAQVIAFLAT